jgi:simple sugar transport system permease protein
MIGQLPRWVTLGLIPLINIALAIFVSSLVLLSIGPNVFTDTGAAFSTLLEAFETMAIGAFGTGDGIGYTLYYATNFIFTGLAVAVAFHAGLFNIGGDGQVYIGGLGAALVALSLGSVAPWWATAPVAIVAAALFGAAWAFIPAYLQAKRGSHIVITTIMFNFIASALMVYILVNVLRPQGSMASQTRNFDAGGRIPKLDGLMEYFGFTMRAAPFNYSFFLALAACVFVWILIWRTKLGYEIRTTGANATAAVYAGMSYVRIVVITMLISGGLAGMMAMNAVLGNYGRLQTDFPAGAGFVGIAVALMGRAHPFGIVLAAVLFGALYQGGAELAFWNQSISREMVVFIQGLVILFAGALENMVRPALVRLFARRPVLAEAAA